MQFTEHSWKYVYDWIGYVIDGNILKWAGSENLSTTTKTVV